MQNGICKYITMGCIRFGGVSDGGRMVDRVVSVATMVSFGRGNTPMNLTILLLMHQGKLLSPVYVSVSCINIH
jgi:hypothetical protein